MSMHPIEQHTLELLIERAMDTDLHTFLHSLSVTEREYLDTYASSPEAFYERVFANYASSTR